MRFGGLNQGGDRMNWVGLLVGLLVSLLFYECTRISPGGLLLPVYVALSLDTPLRAILTTCVMLASYGMLRLLSRYVILFGRRRFAMAVLISCLLGVGLWQLGLVPWGFPLVSYVLPGMGVRDMERQGLPATLLALLAASGIIYLALFAGGLL